MAFFKVTNLTNTTIQVKDPEGNSVLIGGGQFVTVTGITEGIQRFRDKGSLEWVQIPSGVPIPVEDLPEENALDVEVEEAIINLKTEADPLPQYALDPKIFDLSVNMAKTYINMDGHLIFEAPKRNTAQVAGNFFGGGTGNKPIAGIKGFEGMPIAELPRILADTEIWTRPTGTDADEREDGLSLNILIDLMGNGNPSDYKILSITRTLGNAIDDYGKTAAAASVTDFDITAFEVLPGYESGSKTPFFKNYFYIIGALSTYVTGTNKLTHADTANNTNIPMNLECLLNGGIMPLTGAEFTGGFPNCKTVSAMAFDGGQPAQVKLPALMLQTGDSGLALRSITCVKSLSIGDVVYLPAP